MNVHDLPALNACLNGLCTLWLLAAFVSIKAGKKKAHAILMILALLTSVAFLAGYITYHASRGGEVTVFPREYPVARIVYLCILIPHSILAAVNVPLVIMTVLAAARGRFERHRKLAKWSFPIWLYVSVTGVLVYLMLYQWFPPQETMDQGEGVKVSDSGAVQSSRPASESGSSAASAAGRGEVSFDSTTFEHHAGPDEEVLHTSFVMKNVGNGEVRIVGLDTSCTCLDVRADKKILAPGEEALIEADFSLEKLAGEAEKFVYVKTSLPEVKEHRLSVKVTVDPLFEIEPKMLDWTVGEQAEEKRIRFTVLRDEPVHIVSATSSRDLMSVKVEEKEPGKLYELVLKPQTTEDSLLGMVRVVTDCELEKHRHQLVYYSVKQGE